MIDFVGDEDGLFFAGLSRFIREGGTITDDGSTTDDGSVGSDS